MRFPFQCVIPVLLISMSGAISADGVVESGIVEASIPTTEEISAGGRGGRGGKSGGRRSGGVEGSGGARTTIHGKLYEKAISLKEEGSCEKAIPIFECLIVRQSGFEMAAVPLGQCLLDTPAELGVEDNLSSDRIARALFWLTRAADQGDYQAQGYLSQAYVDGSIRPSDPVSAGKWYLIYDRNPVRNSLGVGGLPISERERIYAMLSEEDWVRAEQAAQSWQKKWVSEPVPPEQVSHENCMPHELAQLVGLNLRAQSGQQQSGGRGPR